MPFSDQTLKRRKRRASMLLAVAVGAILGVVSSVAQAAQPWEQPLTTMPIPSGIAELNRTNCVEIVLNALHSNAIVKGVVFMPGATDELYFFKRVKASLTNTAPTLLDAVHALTIQTRMHATFRPPLLLLHTDEDPLEPVIKIESEEVAGKIKATPFGGHAIYNDRDWDAIQPVLRKRLKADIWPSVRSFDSWHFYRHSFAAWNLNGWEALEAVLLAGKTTCRIQKQGALSFRRIVLFFEPDRRVLGVTQPK